MDGVDGMEVILRAREFNPFVVVIVLTGHGSVESAVDALKQGAADYLTKPVNLEELRIRVRKALEVQRLEQKHRHRSQTASQRNAFEGIIGSSDKMRRVLERCLQVAETAATALITGESGTGKELVAKAIHQSSSRRNHHFVPINCAALSPLSQL